MNLSQEAKVIIGISVVTLAIVVGAVFFLSSPNKSEPKEAERVTNTEQLLGDRKRAVTSDGAKVTIVEFGDLQCPACAAAHPTVKQVLADREGEVNFVWRHFPLPMHRNAMVAAVAAEAAGEQGKFWEMHDMLFENQTEWAEENNAKEIFTGYAEELGLDTAVFTEALNSNFNAERIQTDQDDGIALGVNSTPTFFINGEKVNGVISYDEFIQKIDAASK